MDGAFFSRKDFKKRPNQIIIILSLSYVNFEVLHWNIVALLSEKRHEYNSVSHSHKKRTNPMLK